MKKIILSVLITIFCASVHGQTHKKNVIGGSWINTGVTDFYESTGEHNCDIKYFDNNKFVPLYLSFENDKQLKVTFRIEQKIFTYHVNQLSPDSILIYRGKNIYTIFISDNVLKLRYNQNLITFKKVLDKYSEDVFGEYVKDIIFNGHKSYAISFYKGSNKHISGIINRNTFKQKIIELFKCNQVDFVQLGSLKNKSSCLPEIALYYNGRNSSNAPQVIGIFKNKDEVNFLDNTGDIILSLKSN